MTQALKFPLSLLGIQLFLVATLVLAQQPVLNITSIDVPSNNTVEAGGYIDIGVEYDGVWSDASFLGSIELLAGPKDSPQNNVVDIVCVEVPIFGFDCGYKFPKSLPSGQYHWRANITIANTTSSNMPPSLSDTFQVTNITFDCATPDPWENITSTSDPKYTSLGWDGPYAGDIVAMDSARDGGIVLGWTYRDERNTADPNASISDMTMEAVNAKTGAIGGVLTMDPTANVAYGWDFKKNSITWGGWRLRMNYTNKLEGSPLGTPVSALGEVFIVTTGDSCPVGFAASGKGAKSGGGGFGSFEGVANAWRPLALFGLVICFLL